MGEREEKRKNFVEGKNRLKRRRKRGEIFGLAKKIFFGGERKNILLWGTKKTEKENIWRWKKYFGEENKMIII